MSSDAVLELSNIHKRFGGVVAANDLSVSIDGGSCTAIVGPNGAGKSTLLNIVCGLVRQDHGDVYWRGKKLGNESFRVICGRGIQRMFQELRLFDSMTVTENLACGLVGSRPGSFGLWSKRGSEPAMERIEEVLTTLELGAQRDRLVLDLSYAERKLVALGRALVSEPGLLLLDEPASGLDRRSLEIVIQALANVRAQGTGVLIVEHNLEVVRQMASRALLLEEGNIVADASPDVVFRDSNFGRVFFSMNDTTPTAHNDGLVGNGS